MSGWRAVGLSVVAFVACGETTRDAPAEPRAPTAGHAAGDQAGRTTTEPQPMGGARVIGGSGGASAGVIGGAGGASDTGASGTGGETCAAAAPRCLAGEQACHPTLGKLGTCDACGVVTEVDMAGPDCVRLIASDKESRDVCVVLGHDRLECWDGSYLPTKTTLPAGVVRLILPDDFPSGSTAEPCLRFASGASSCGLSGCQDVALGERGVCGACGGQMYCEGDIATPPVPQTGVVDIDVTDMNVIVLGAAGVQFPFREPSLPANWLGVPARLTVDHELGGCMISDRQEMACWVEVTELPAASSWKGSFTKVIASTLPRACGLDPERQVRCGDVFADSTPAAVGEADSVDFVASWSLVCTLSVTGRVKCFSEPGMEPLELPPGW